MKPAVALSIMRSGISDIIPISEAVFVGALCRRDNPMMATFIFFLSWECTEADHHRSTGCEVRDQSLVEIGQRLINQID